MVSNLNMFFNILQAVVFVIDSSNKERLDEAQNELVKLVAEKELKDAFILILLNKQVKITHFTTI